MRSSSKRLLLWSLFIAFCLALLVQQTVLQKRLPIETNVLNLLPQNQQDEIAQQAFDKIAENINNRLIFLIKGTNKDNLVNAAETFSNEIMSLGLFSDVLSSIDENQQQAWGALYFPYRAQLLSDADKKSLAAPEKRIDHVIQQLYNPFSGVSSGELTSDPFLLFRDYLSTRNSSNGHFSLYKNYLLNQVNQDTYLIIQADLAGDAFDNKLQALLPQLNTIERKVEQKFHVKLLHTGSLFYAAYGTESAKSEISTIGVGSLLGILILLLCVYRSTLPLMLALLSISCGLLVAFVVTVLVFGKIHLFSLVFGASLIGVSIDYAFHYLTERLLHQGRWDPDLALKSIFKAISFGLITSLVGYLGLLMAPFPGLQQLSLFSIVGLLSAYLTVVFCYPALARSKSKTTPPNLNLLGAWLALWQKRWLTVVLPCFFIAFAWMGLMNVTVNDDIRQLQAMPDTLKEQEYIIKEITGVGNNQRLLLVKADSEELLLQRLETLSDTFKVWKKEGVIGGFQSISQFVPSIKTQQSNYQQVKSLYEQQGPILSERLNFTNEVKFEEVFKPLYIDTYLRSPVSDALGFLWLGDIANKTASVMLLSDISVIPTNNTLINNYIAQQSDVVILDKAAEISEIFSHYRYFISKMLMVTYLLIGFVLIWRYGLKMGVKVIAPPFVAGFVALAITAFFSVPITIFNLLALLLVLGIGIDYTLFFAEQKETAQNKNTFLAITLSAITTILSFGLLALSETQAIHGFGVTVLTGIIVAWLLAPLAMKK